MAASENPIVVPEYEPSEPSAPPPADTDTELGRATLGTERKELGAAPPPKAAVAGGVALLLVIILVVAGGGSGDCDAEPCSCPPASASAGAGFSYDVGTELAVAKVTVALPGGGGSVSAASLASALSFGSGGSVGPHIGALSTRRALIRAVASAADGTRYFVWDDDDNPLNNIGGLSGIDGLRSACAEFGLRAVRITSAETVDLTLRPLLQNAGYDLSRGSGVPLAMDCSADNTYSSLDDASIAVTDILASLHESFGYTGDHQTDQSARALLLFVVVADSGPLTCCLLSRR